MLLRKGESTSVCSQVPSRVDIWQYQDRQFSPLGVNTSKCLECVGHCHLPVCTMDRTKGCLQQLPTFFITYTLMDQYYNSLSVDATVIVSNKCPVIGKQVIVTGNHTTV